MVELTAAEVSDMRGWRHDLHRRPELGFGVDETASFVATCLREFGVDEVHTGIGRSGVVGVLRNGTGPSIGLRADMDALPIQEVGARDHRSEVDGVFHGCGHDGHTAMLLGAARYLADARSFEGTVHLVFQPDEENGRGAAAMIDDGLFERFDMAAIFGMHNKPGMPVGTFATRIGPMMSSEDLFEIVIVGRGGHASTPERHIDPVVIGAEIIQSLQTIVSRSVAAIETAVVSVTEVTTDGARNIVPTTVTIRGDCRTFSAAVQHRIEERMRDLVSGICAAHGATGTVDYSHEFVPLVNTADETAIAIGAAAAVVGAANVNGDGDLVTASEDFARYLERIPGCFIDIGNGEHGDCGSSLHNPSYDFNDDALAIGTRYWVQLVSEYASRT
ncbi:M20 aminoacylase family protein [Ilumatobacter nonamiensis]|uniref:M20 aminoacylase family protein n=1 Tax=Ilumatobacter nonamiensis TaxID=467093 RepID=UPI00058B4562|nr:M20 aminoacylase family protein [Ilumatobacter nonamiensis]